MFIRNTSKKTVVEWFKAVGAENGVFDDVRDSWDNCGILSRPTRRCRRLSGRAQFLAVLMRRITWRHIGWWTACHSKI